MPVSLSDGLTLLPTSLSISLKPLCRSLRGQEPHWKCISSISSSFLLTQSCGHSDSIYFKILCISSLPPSYQQPSSLSAASPLVAAASACLHGSSSSSKMGTVVPSTSSAVSNPLQPSASTPAIQLKNPLEAANQSAVGGQQEHKVNH